MREDFSMHVIDTGLETSVTITLSLSHVVVYLPCGAAAVPWPQRSCWSSKRGAVMML